MGKRAVTSDFRHGYWIAGVTIKSYIVIICGFHGMFGLVV